MESHIGSRGHAAPGTDSFSINPEDALEPETSRPIREKTGETITDISSCVEEDGRTYQAYMPGEYFLPNDGEEQDRLDFSHRIYDLIMDGRLAEAPIISHSQVLDIGTGTGIWALEFAKENPTSFVIGTDLSQIQPVPWMSNCKFVVENSELEDWTFPDLFDYVHLRGMHTCFNNTQTVMTRAFNHMNPGGWIELQDGSWDLQSIDGSADNTALAHFSHMVRAGGMAIGRDLTKARLYKEQLLQVGFVDVMERVIPIPGNPWCLGQKKKRIGSYTAAAWSSFVPDSFRKFVNNSGLSQTEIDNLIAQAKHDASNPGIRWFLPLYIVYGRKPHEREVAVA